MYRICLFLFLFCCSCTFKKPTEFSGKALSSVFYTSDNSKIDFKSILSKHKGNIVLIDVWASSCGDCVAGFPALKEFQRVNKEVVYLFLSIDSNFASWKRGIERYDLQGEHFFMEAGLLSEFGKFLNSNSIPRYLLIDENGLIDVYKATKVTDPGIAEALKK